MRGISTVTSCTWAITITFVGTAALSATPVRHDEASNWLHRNTSTDLDR